MQTPEKQPVHRPFTLQLKNGKTRSFTNGFAMSIWYNKQLAIEKAKQKRFAAIQGPTA